MEAEQKRVVKGLEKAMQAEMEGYHFYQMAAKSTADAKGRETFEYLAKEEEGHFNFLKAQMESIAQTGQVAADVKLSEKREFSGSHPIFSDEIKSRVGQAHHEMTALSVAMQLEKSAVDFYGAEAEAAADPQVKAFYRELMTWEQGHLTALRAEADALKEDYWQEARFAPF
jgi:rubrerythrin